VAGWNVAATYRRIVQTGCLYKLAMKRHLLWLREMLVPVTGTKCLSPRGMSDDDSHCVGEGSLL
jgi:hypothetical protein